MDRQWQSWIRYHSKPYPIPKILRWAFKKPSLVFYRYVSDLFSKPFSVIKEKRNDRFFPAADYFIKQLVPGLDDGQSTHGIRSLYDYNSPQSPILLLLSGGVDPTSDVEALAAEMEVDLIQIALENKNDTVAEVMIKLHFFYFRNKQYFD